MPSVVSLVPLKRFQDTGVGLPQGWRFQFLDTNTEDDVIAACQGADFLLAKSGYSIKISSRIIENIPSVRLIQMDGVGCDTVDLDAAATHNLPVANSAGQNAGAVAELTISLIIALQRYLLEADRDIKNGNYTRVRTKLLAAGLREIRDTKLGLVGFGAIGREVAKVAGVMGARISYYDAYRPAKDIEAELKAAYKPLDEVLAGSDVISMHVPLNEKTQGMIGRREFGLMRSGSLFINTARGEVVDQAALAEVLESGHLGGAAIDTLSPEPPSPDHPLLKLSPAARDRLIITPHLAGVTVNAFRRMLLNALENMKLVSEGKAPKYVVNGVLNPRTPK